MLLAAVSVLESQVVLVAYSLAQVADTLLAEEDVLVPDNHQQQLARSHQGLGVDIARPLVVEIAAVIPVLDLHPSGDVAHERVVWIPTPAGVGGSLIEP